MTDTTQKLLNARYGQQTDLPLLGSAVVDQILAHRTVRAFTDQPLADGTLETLVAAAQSAASSSNLQAVSVIAVRDPERKARLSQVAGGQLHVREAPLLLVWVADLSRLDRVAARLQKPSDANQLTEMLLVAIVDAALAAQNAALAAESLGLGTCYIGALRNQVEGVAEELHLPPRAFAVFGLCVGHADPARPAAVKPRLPLSTILHHEVYAPDQDVSDIEAYDAVMQTFQRSESMKVVPWSQLASSRVSGPGSLSGRHLLAAWLKARGLMLD